MLKNHIYYVYLLTNKNNHVIYTGVTNNLERRIWEHKFSEGSKFTSKYKCHKLVYYEEYQWIQDAISREKQIKSGSRKAKLILINSTNPDWNDLSDGWF